MSVFRCRSLASRGSAGFTLVELLVVMAIIAILISLLMPAVQMAREAARRSKCSNQLRQVAVALLNYESSNKTFPPGGLSTAAGGYGHSWWVRILPYLEETETYNDFQQYGENTGWLGKNGNVDNRNLLYKQHFPFMECPSTTLDRWGLTTAEDEYAYIEMSSYTGISGAEGHPTTRDQKNPNGTASGRVSFGGVLIVGRGIAISDIRDGTSKTMVVSEQSSWCIDQNATRRDCRSDCGCGFTMGPANNDPYERHYNLSCMLHPIGTTNYEALGIPGNCGPNRPLLSQHGGGVNAVYADGSVQYLDKKHGNPCALQPRKSRRWQSGCGKRMSMPARGAQRSAAPRKTANRAGSGLRADSSAPWPPWRFWDPRRAVAARSTARSRARSASRGNRFAREWWSSPIWNGEPI